jgi:chromosome segregation ATPase
MNRRLQIVNLFGVLVLAALCVVQWRHDRQLNLQINQLEKSWQQLDAKTQELEKKLRANSEDADYFRAQLSKTTETLSDTEKKLDKSELQASTLVFENDQLKDAITNWATAVSSRDEQIRKLAGDLNNSIEKFNHLATNHNTLVREFNDLRARSAAQSQEKGEAGKAGQ